MLSNKAGPTPTSPAGPGRGWANADPAALARQAALMDTTFAPFNRHLLAAADCRDGQHVLDVGCGTGMVTLAVARQVGESGRVVAVDIAGPMCDLARSAAATARLPQITVMQADAATAPYDSGSFDRVVSRFGTMFFIDPIAAFAHLRSAMRSGGTMTFVAFADRAANPWVDLPVSVLARHLQRQGQDVGADPMAFSMADPDRTAEHLTAAGLTAVTVAPVTERVTLGSGGGVDSAMAHLLDLELPARIINRLDPYTRTPALDDLRAELARLVDSDGAVRLPATAWLVAAENGD